MGNLFRHAPAEQGRLTSALLALLEHSDRELLNGFMRRAGLPYQSPPDASLQLSYPLPGTGASAGEIAGPGFRLVLVAQNPDQPWSPPPITSDTVLVTMGGRSEAGARVLTWEQVDRWLAAALEQYDPDSRTGFLVRQFREFLHDSGIEYFPGFPPQLLEQAPGALATLASLYQAAETFLDRLGPALSAMIPDLAQLRRARADDLMAGYCYRDFSSPVLGPSGFLRVALHVPQEEVQVSLWLGPGPIPALDAHFRLRKALLEDQGFRESLQAMAGHPVLWLWSEQAEHRLPADEVSAEAIAGLDWGRYQTGLQVAFPFADAAGEGLTERVADRVDKLWSALSPVLSSPLH